MKFLAAAFALITTAGSGQAETANEAMAGTWARDDGKAHVEVKPCDGGLCATNIWVRPGTARERVGDMLVMDVAPVDDEKYAGSAHDVRRKLNYHIDVSISASDDSMTTRGCLLGRIICKTAGWQRIN
ncbi:DUF2147 domain-containing protein [Martelella sp. HB161492]|uniref:DUF2147 domain-containing protein n=1 Tax=Martelella sp. HB161492 TaxID=2720726 RepID=UPI001FEF38C2|nr:DUF2147 domain-containing protein [Martelella sp. HB161492]